MEGTPTTWSLSVATMLLELAAKTGVRYAARKEKDKVRNRMTVTIFEVGRLFTFPDALPVATMPYSCASKIWPLFHVSF